MDDGSRLVLHVDNLARAADGSGDDAVLLTVGGHVRICGLKARLDLNGRAGTLQALDEASHRWTVLLDGETSEKSVREANLEPLGAIGCSAA
mmetsp:Transcript_127867/g.322867  ORF Transcript_127867/g.322867 Transcript_127867/m.322867 type:complete len:92 (+) Transcript_127867:2-277(+)